MGAEQSLQTKKSVDKKDKKPVDKKIVKKPVDKKIVKKPVDKKVVKKPVEKKVVKKPVDKKIVKKSVDKKVVKKLIKGGRNVKPYHPEGFKKSIYRIEASELNNEHIGMILRCPKLSVPEAGIIESINFYYDKTNNEPNKKIDWINVDFVYGTSFVDLDLRLSPNDICYLEKV